MSKSGANNPVAPGEVSEAQGKYEYDGEKGVWVITCAALSRSRGSRHAAAAGRGEGSAGVKAQGGEGRTSAMMSTASTDSSFSPASSAARIEG